MKTTVNYYSADYVLFQIHLNHISTMSLFSRTHYFHISLILKIHQNAFQNVLEYTNYVSTHYVSRAPFCGAKVTYPIIPTPEEMGFFWLDNYDF